MENLDLGPNNQARQLVRYRYTFVPVDPVNCTST